MLNKLLFIEKFAHHVLLLFYPFRNEKELLSGFPPFCQNKLQEYVVQDVVKINKIKLEPYDDLDEQAYSKFHDTLINNQDAHFQNENVETSGTEYANENYSEDRETNKTSVIPNFIPKLLPAYEIGENINSLNSKQGEVLYVVHKWIMSKIKILCKIERAQISFIDWRHT